MEKLPPYLGRDYFRRFKIRIKQFFCSHLNLEDCDENNEIIYKNQKRGGYICTKCAFRYRAFKQK